MIARTSATLSLILILLSFNHLHIFRRGNTQDQHAGANEKPN
jgi:hypothetical protein